MQVKDAMTRDAEVIRPDATLEEAAETMRQLDVGFLPVCDGRHLRGTVTDRDITVRATTEGVDPRATPVEVVMTPEIVYCFEDQEVAEAARMMQDHGVRRLPVLDRKKRLVGVISLDDLAIGAGDERLAGEVIRAAASQPSASRSGLYQRILVALDGSPLAERVLPHAKALAEKFDATVTLLRATSRPADVALAEASAGAIPVAAPLLDPTQVVAAEQQDARHYLDNVAARLRDQRLTVDVELAEGAAAEAILACAAAREADLIAMTTHGRSGLGRLVMGSVADEVLRGARCPILLVRVADEEAESA